MTKAPSLIFLAGSAREDSVNKKIARAAANMAEGAGATATLIDLCDSPMPLCLAGVQQRAQRRSAAVTNAPN